MQESVTIQYLLTGDAAHRRLDDDEEGERGREGCRGREKGLITPGC